MIEEFEQDLAALLNKHCLDNETNTPDFILAGYLIGCIDMLRQCNMQRDRWHGFKPLTTWPGEIVRPSQQEKT